jgi:hypothetical protein
MHLIILWKGHDGLASATSDGNATELLGMACSESKIAGSPACLGRVLWLDA